MARANFQCLIIPFMIVDNEPKYAIFKRSDRSIWQFLSGGGEDNETPIEAAKRECFEEAQIPSNIDFYELDAISTVPSEIFSQEYRKNWPKDCYVLNEYKFAFKLEEDIIKISDEHSEYRWVSYEEAFDLLKYDSNRVALRELKCRIKDNNFKEAK